MAVKRHHMLASSVSSRWWHCTVNNAAAEKVKSPGIGMAISHRASLKQYGGVKRRAEENKYCGGGQVE